jgi:hypothetical protein
MSRELMKQLGINGDLEEHPDRPGWAKEMLSTSVTAFVDNKPQLLRPMRPFVQMATMMPSDLSNNARIVLLALLDVFKRAGYVKEGIADDLLWGFQQCGMDPTITAYGLVDLRREGYIRFETPDGINTDEQNTKLAHCWVRYTDKIMNMVYSG